MALIIYGIRNCNTVKSALDWLRRNGVDFDFHDFKSKGVSEEKLKAWCNQSSWEALLNKRGTTWRQLPESVQQNVNGERAAIALMQEKTSVIKRPILESDGKMHLVGFDEAAYENFFKKKRKAP